MGTLFSVDSNDFLLIYLILKASLDGRIIAQWVHHIPVITCDEEIECYSTRIYFYDNFRRIVLWVSVFRLNGLCGALGVVSGG